MSRVATKPKPKSKPPAKAPKAKPADRGETPFIYRVVNAKEAADFLKVTEKVVIEEAKAGNLPGRLLGGEWRFALSAIYDWLKKPNGKTSKREQLLGLAGVWEDDSALEEMMEEIYQNRKRNPVGGS